MTINAIFFKKCSKFSFVIMNGSRLIGGCFPIISGPHYVESTRTKFGVLAYSRIITVGKLVQLVK